LRFRIALWQPVQLVLAMMQLSCLNSRTRALLGSFLLTGAIFSLSVSALAEEAEVESVSKQLLIGFDSERFVDYGDVRITQSDVDAFLQRVPADRRADVLTDPERIGRLLTNIYLTDVFLPMAEEEGLLQEDIVQARLYRALMHELRDIYRERFLASIELDDYSSLAREIYLSRPDDFLGPERVDFQHILVHVGRSGDEVEAMSRIIELHRMISEGADFGEVAREHSDDPSVADNQGLFENVDPADLVEQVAMMLGRTRQGRLSAPVRSRHGWHLVKLTGVHPRELREWEEVKDRVLVLARERHRGDAYERLLRDAQDRPAEFAEGAVARLLARYGLDSGQLSSDDEVGSALRPE
jgi:peptidyl-prolyl cis-trans isomerase C